MSKEYEIVSHTQLKYITAFLVRLEERMTHVHRDLEIGYILDGTVSLHMQNQTTQFSKGDVYIINPMEPHDFTSEGRGVLLIAVQIAPKFISACFPDAHHLYYQGNPNLRIALENAPGQFSHICASCVELAYSYMKKEQNYEFRCFSMASTLLYLIHKDLPWTLMDPSTYQPMKQRTNRLISITDYIDQNFQRKLLLSEIAQNEDLSLTYISHFFKDNMGMSFQEYLNQKRFEYACHLLFTTEWTILDISVSSGFSDTRYFTEAFLKQYGCTPKDYRNGVKINLPKGKILSANTQYFFTPEDAVLMISPLRDSSMIHY